MNLEGVIRGELEQASKVLHDFMQHPSSLRAIEEAAKQMVSTIQSNGKIISCGNGGSHCDAMHFAEELTGKYRDHRRAFPALCISDPSHISCVGNDYGYEFVFSRYIEALAQKGDTLLAISTSGNSPSILQAAKAAKEKGMTVIVLTGPDGGQLAPLADVAVCVPHPLFSDRIQEVHIKIIHVLILLIERLTE